MWTKRKNEATVNRHDVDLSLLGKNARFKGAITFEGTARIDGRLEGDISTDGTLVIGEEAVVEGNIVARTVICAGTITGDIVASERVELTAPAVLTGRIKTPRLSLQEGVSFFGTSEVQSPRLGSSEQASTIDPLESATTAQAATETADRLSRKKLIPWSPSTDPTAAPATGKIAIGE
jgi:cytoskeletal protein CcmA (bactofilin family)